ncbi:MAG: hypothetical protein O2820_12145, partial [Planctomycetota bacterium]|nr:hypothetical protein [Planctomycetota bacterium]
MATPQVDQSSVTKAAQPQPNDGRERAQKAQKRILCRMALPGIFAEISAAANLAGMAAFVFC